MSDNVKNMFPQGMPKISPKLIILVIVVVLIAGVAMTSFFVVDQTEEAVVLRLGRYNRTVGPGLQWKWPLGLEKNLNVETQIIKNMEFGFRRTTGVSTSRDFVEESIMLTGDLNIVDVEWIIQYRISDPYQWLFNLEDQERTIRDISQSVLNQLVGDRAILNILGSSREEIEIGSQDLLNQYFENYGLGVNVTAVRLQNIVPPVGRVQDAFEDVNKAIQDMNRLINEGREAINREIPRARGQAQQEIQIAQGYATERINRAQGDVARFNAVLEEYEDDPETTRDRLYYEAMEEVFSGQEGIRLIDRNLDNVLPLFNLNNQGGVQ
ncbi:FtsH protease activity modulator HflK [Spirochaeta lutea]|uniref:Protein HflK n=1 Tax=Spirochaeta lutea TaxID=1480694 RepID=A0A098QZ12_9SPIO|nr:FtsH protease activity modulator HflK [Spirochaeta lutea]KGE73145.1 membrane protease HflK [Spirochaeta lutea]